MAAHAPTRAHTASDESGTRICASPGENRSHRPARPPHGDSSWRIEDHVCRVCFNRVLSRPADEGGRIYRCTGCGLEAAGHAPSVVCACGMRLKNGRDLGVRCVLNESPSPEAPVQVVARQVVT